MKAAVALRPRGRVPLWAKVGAVAILAASFLVVFTLLPLPIPPYLDFQVLYQTDMGLLRGISPYDHAGQVDMIARLAHVQPQQVYALPFPYPPWYALGTIWLAWLPIDHAVRLWFGIGLILLGVSLWLLTDGWSVLKRLAALGLGVCFLPVLGSLAVGQYVFPVLLGAALMIFGLRREKPALVTAGIALLTFKPHVGVLLILAALIYLGLRRDAFARRTMLYVLVAAAVLFCLGFLADRTWPASYLRSLLAFQQDSGVATCGLCASLPTLIASRIPGGTGLGLAFVIGLLILILLSGILLLFGRRVVHEPMQAVASATLVMLLASPYLLNYDFVLLLVPLAMLAGGERKPVDWVVLLAAYVVPFAALMVWGRQGNFVLPLCAAVLLFMQYRDMRSLDVSLPPA